MLISQNIKTIRELWDLSQTSMGYVVGATKNMIQSYERGKADPPKFIIERLSKLTGFYSIEQLEKQYVNILFIKFLPKKVCDAIEFIERIENGKREFSKLNSKESQLYLFPDSKTKASELMRLGLRKRLEDDNILNNKKILQREFKIDIDNSGRVDLFPLFLEDGIIEDGITSYEEYPDIRGDIGGLPYFDLVNPKFLIDLVSVNGQIELLLDDYKNTFFTIPISGIVDCDFAIDAFVNDMAPKIKNRDIIICKIISNKGGWSSIRYGETYVIICKDSHSIRKIKKGKDEEHFLLEGENQDYDPFEIDKKNILGLCLIKAVINRFIL